MCYKSKDLTAKRHEAQADDSLVQQSQAIIVVKLYIQINKKYIFYYLSYFNHINSKHYKNVA